MSDVRYGAYGDMSCASPPDESPKPSPEDIEEQAVQLMARSSVVGSDSNARRIFDVLRLGGFRIIRTPR